MSPACKRARAQELLAELLVLILAHYIAEAPDDHEGLERQSVCLRSRNHVFAAHRGVAPQLLGPTQRLRRALRCLQLRDFARSGKPIGALADMMKPIQRQNEAIRQSRQRRRSPVDVDPDTGAEGSCETSNIKTPRKAVG